MRRATMSTAWLLSSSGTVEGLSLGSDACSEHEWGVEGLRQALGVPKRFIEGLPDRVATRQPPALALHTYGLPDGTPAAWLVMGTDRLVSMSSASPTRAVPASYRDEVGFSATASAPNIICAWDADGILVHVRTQPEIDRLHSLYNAIANKDIAFGGDLIDRQAHPRASGLIFVIASQVPADTAARALAKDQSGVRLRTAAEATGIEAELRAAGRTWFALSPRWQSSQEQEVVFWLNPMEQSDFNAGLFPLSSCAPGSAPRARS